MLHLSDQAFLNPLHRRAITNRRGNLGSKLSNHASLDRMLGQNSDLRNIMAHRLLAIHMLAGINGRHSNNKMVMIRHRNIYGVDILFLLLKHFPPIGIQSSPWNLLCSLFQMVFIHITKGHDLDVGMRFKLLQIMSAHSADTYTGMPELLGRSIRESLIKEKRGRSRHPRNGTDKIPSGS